MFTYGFYNSLNGDRKYNAEQMSAIFDGLIGDGVFATINNVFDVTPGDGLEVLVDAGKAWFNHTWNVNDSKMPLALSAADVSYPRIDAVVLEINKGIDVRENSIKIIEGTPATSPEKPTLIQEEPLYQYPFAYITVPANASSITIANIEKTIGQAPCPFVTGILKTVDISVLFTTWQGTFEDWFAHLKTELSGDVAANLQRQIDEINDQLILMTQNVGILEITVKTSEGNPIVGLPIPDLYTQPDGNAKVITRFDGIARGYISEGHHDIKISGYLDLEDNTVSVDIVRGKKQNITLELVTRNFYQITTTKNDCKFSSNVDRLDITLVGGGGGGGGGTYRPSSYGGSYPNANKNYTYISGGGGGGGAVVVETNVPFSPDEDYSAIVGSGGDGGNGGSVAIAYGGVGYIGADGGATSFLNHTASGGIGGPAGKFSSEATSPPSSSADGGDPNGGKGGRQARYYMSNTSASTSTLMGGILNNPGSGGIGYNGYSSFSDEITYGKGGGAGVVTGGAIAGIDFSKMNPGNKGSSGSGADYGNKGTADQVVATPGTANTGGGGGGGVTMNDNVTTASSYLKGAAGGSGVITIRMYLINE